jgi:hypothetical protein
VENLECEVWMLKCPPQMRYENQKEFTFTVPQSSPYVRVERCLG